MNNKESLKAFNSKQKSGREPTQAFHKLSSRVCCPLYLRVFRGFWGSGGVSSEPCMLRYRVPAGGRSGV